MFQSWLKQHLESSITKVLQYVRHTNGQRSCITPATLTGKSPVSRPPHWRAKVLRCAHHMNWRTKSSCIAPATMTGNGPASRLPHWRAKILRCAHHMHWQTKVLHRARRSDGQRSCIAPATLIVKVLKCRSLCNFFPRSISSISCPSVIFVTYFNALKGSPRVQLFLAHWACGIN